MAVRWKDKALIGALADDDNFPVTDTSDSDTDKRATAAKIHAYARNPTSDDGDSLGTASLKWSDAFFAAGAVVNFNSGNVTITHSAGALALNNPDVTGLNVTSASGSESRALEDRFDDVINIDDFGVAGDGSTDDEAAVDSFVTAIDGEKSFVAPGTYLTSGINLSGLSGSFNLGGVDRWLSEFKRDSDGGNFLSLNENDNCQIADLSIDNDYSTNGNSGHGITIADSDYVDVQRVRVRNYGNNGGSAGTGLLAFPSGQTTVRNVTFDDVIVSADDSDSTNTNGVLIDTGRYCRMHGVFVESVISFAIEYKNDTRYSLISDGIVADSKIAFGYGQATVGDDGCDFNVAANMVAHACDEGLTTGEANNNLFANLLVDSTDAPDRGGGGIFWGARFGNNSDENLLDGLLTFGANMTYAVRCDGNRNAVSVADHSGAASVAVFGSGAAANYVNVLHPGTRTSISGAINDASGNATDGTSANVVDSPLTREYIGSVAGNFHWKLADSTASFLSTQRWRYETDGNNILAFASPGNTSEVYGFAVNINGTNNYASLIYTKKASAASEFWLFRVGDSAVLRLFDSVLRPNANDGLALGTATASFSDLFLADGGVINWNNGDATLTHSSGLLTSNAPFKLPSYTVAGVPSASTLGAATMIYVSNGAAGSPILAFSDGTNWLRSDTGGAISAS